MSERRTADLLGMDHKTLKAMGGGTGLQKHLSHSLIMILAWPLVWLK